MSHHTDGETQFLLISPNFLLISSLNRTDFNGTVPAVGLRYLETVCGGTTSTTFVFCSHILSRSAATRSETKHTGIGVNQALRVISTCCGSVSHS